MNDHLRLSFGMSCVITAPFRIRGRGDQFAPIWQGLVMDGDYDSRVDFNPGPSGEFKCVANVKTEGRTVCTALQGTIGAGRVLFIADTRALSMFSDAGYQRGNHAEAASRLLDWLVEEPSARALSFDNSSASPISFNSDSVMARFFTSDLTTVWRRVQKAVDRTEQLGALPPGREVGTHTFRHSYARHLLMTGIPIDYLSRRLGYSSTQTTLIYLEVVPDPSLSLAMVPSLSTWA